MVSGWRRAAVGFHLPIGPLLGLSIFLSIGLGACTVGPDYRPPATQVPAVWTEAPATGVKNAPLEIIRWWSLFQDPQLDSLVERAVGSNIDLRVAEARIREARSQRGVIAADAYPALNTSGSYTRYRPSENSPGGSALGSPSSGLDLFQLGFDASWEIDLFGGVRRAVEAADATIGVTEEARRDVLVTLVSEVARYYIQVRGSQLRIGIAMDNIKAQSHTLEVAQERYRAGLGNRLEVEQAKAQLAATQSAVPILETALKQAVHRLGVLLGQEPGALGHELSRDAPIPPVPPEVPVGLPSDLLRRRPDLRRAERQLAAATAQIGVATADLFPKFSLTGVLGQESSHFGDIARSGSSYWSIGPSLRWPLFDAGRIRANIQVQNARQEQAFFQYEQTVLKALEDVENALVAYDKEQTSRRSLAQSVDSTRQAVDIANELYTRGLVDFLNVLVSQRSLFQAQEALAQSDQRVSTNLVALFKALGGGWEVAPQ